MIPFRVIARECKEIGINAESFVANAPEFKKIVLDEDTTDVLTFGTDTSLKTTPGRDNVTGLGTPNGKAFADYFNPGR